MAGTPALPSLAETIALHGLATKKSLGQHFLLDADWLERVVHAAGNLGGKHVLEVGPGPGGLTRALLESDAARVHAVEKDARCIAALAPLHAHYPERFHLVHGDALDIDIVQALPEPRAIVANLPYNVGTELALSWLMALHTYGPHAWDVMVVMLQYEVAERMLAKPGSKAYGRLSVITQWLCDGAIALHVPPEAFHPPPKVDSAVLQLRPLQAPRYPADLPTLERVVATAFNQRRKMLRSSLKPLGCDVAALCAAAGVPETLRADACSIEQFCRLACALVKMLAHETAPTTNV
jgi:16S rRNA (adenine1518-N6/adenine1519-N6)-dimethyltransferase